MITLLGTFIIAGAFNIKDEDFTKKVRKVDSTKLCEKENIMKVKFKKCKGEKTKIDIPNDIITQNKDGVYKIEYGQ